MPGSRAVRLPGGRGCGYERAAGGVPVVIETAQDLDPGVGGRGALTCSDDKL